MLPGQGISGKRRFTSFTVRNLHTVKQDVELYLGEREFVDNRMMADVNGLISVINAGASRYDEKITELTAAGMFEVVSLKADRLSATFSADSDGMLWHDNTVSAEKGIPYSAGKIYEIKNTAPLFFYSIAAGWSHVLEDLI